jgi:SAM-dependent methyltransferase
MEPADFYSGIVVDVYAKLKSSTFDPAPYREFVQAHGEPALEIGCGDGEPLLDLCAAGLEVDGVDSSLDMVERCRANAARRGVVTNVFHQRAESLTLGQRYAAIYFAGPTFNLLTDDETARQALSRIREHLTDGGAALVPLWVPDPTTEADLGVTRVGDGERGVELRYTPLSETFDLDGCTRTTTTRYERVVDGRSEVADREWIIHWQTPDSMRHLCADVGLEVVAMVDDDTHEAASATSASFTATVRRAPRFGRD